MNSRKVDDDILLVPYFPNEDITLKWYQDKELCRQVDNRDDVYAFNKQSQMMFQSVGFQSLGDEWYIYKH